MCSGTVWVDGISGATYQEFISAILKLTLTYNTKKKGKSKIVTKTKWFKYKISYNLVEVSTSVFKGWIKPKFRFSGPYDKYYVRIFTQNINLFYQINIFIKLL